MKRGEYVRVWRMRRIRDREEEEEVEMEKEKTGSYWCGREREKEGDDKE